MPPYEITVWDHEGNIVEKRWEANDEELDEIEERFADDPMVTVQVEDKDYE